MISQNDITAIVHIIFFHFSQNNIFGHRIIVSKLQASQAWVDISYSMTSAEWQLRVSTARRLAINFNDAFLTGIIILCRIQMLIQQICTALAVNC